jgi:hypothetical protein
MSTLNKLSTSFTKTRMLKQYNNLRNRSTINMDDEELTSHRETLRLIEKGLQFQDEDDK